MKDSTRNSNGYTLVYAAGLILVAAALLAFVSQQLAPRQKSNMLTEKRMYVLRAVHLQGEPQTARNLNAYVEERYNKYITDTTVTDDHLPLYICRTEDGKERYVIPLNGQGLWGAIWGYMAIDYDRNTVYGAVFDHESETPGLGAEIATEEFGHRFDGKVLFKYDGLISITVTKKGSGSGMAGSVDAISGGTLTSRGVENMIRTGMEPYFKYLKNGK